MTSRLERLTASFFADPDGDGDYPARLHGDLFLEQVDVPEIGGITLDLSSPLDWYDLEQLQAYVDWGSSPSQSTECRLRAYEAALEKIARQPEYMTSDSMPRTHIIQLARKALGRE